MNYGGVYLAALYAFNTQLNGSVVYKNDCALSHVPGETLERNAGYLLVAYPVLGGEHKAVAVVQGNGSAVCKFAQSYLRAFGIKKCGYGKLQLVPYAAQLIISFFVDCIVPVGKVESCNVHARKHHFSEYIVIVCSGTDGTHYLGFSHKSYPLLLKLK